MAAYFHDFQSLIEHGPDAVSLIDRQGEILYGSASTTKLFGYLPEEIVGRNCLELVHPEDRDHCSEELQELLAKPSGPLRSDLRIRHKNGNYSWVENTIFHLPSETALHAIVVHQRDINSRRLAEIERQRQVEEMARFNLRLKEFAQTVAHDLREPVRTISMFTEMLIEKTPVDADTGQIARFIVEGAARMSALINDLLSFAGTGVSEPFASVDLRAALAQASQNLAVDIKVSGATIATDWLPVAQGNENHLVRLLQNLISNALKYRRPQAIEIFVSAVRLGPDWLIRIRDNGIGIAVEDHARIFMPFTRVGNREIPGTGLGLPMCKQIVEGMRGSIWVESELGAGSTFCFTIPAEPGLRVTRAVSPFRKTKDKA